MAHSVVSNDGRHVFMSQAVDVDALHAEGLDLDFVDQMKDLSVVGDDSDSQASRSDVLAAFDRSAPSTKVLSASMILSS